MNRIIFLLSVTLFAGCAAPQATPYRAPAVVDTQTPVCSSKRQCEAMWLDAQETLQMVTRMRIRTATDSRIETFAPTRPSSMGGVVTKYPVADNKYELRLRLECYRNMDCGDLKALGTNLFNNSLSGFYAQ